MVCAFIEGYQDTKVIILSTNSSDAIQTAKSLIPTPEKVSEITKLSFEQSQLLLDFRNSMIGWAAEVVSYTENNNKNILSTASNKLERSIDGFSKRCEEQGWHFQKNWR